MAGRPRKVREPVYRAVRRLVIDGRVFEPGDVVPGAASWLRLESWVKARRVELVDA
jgi:hypothetical protein